MLYGRNVGLVDRLKYNLILSEQQRQEYKQRVKTQYLIS